MNKGCVLFKFDGMGRDTPDTLFTHGFCIPVQHIADMYSTWCTSTGVHTIVITVAKDGVKIEHTLTFENEDTFRDMWNHFAEALIQHHGGIAPTGPA